MLFALILGTTLISDNQYLLPMSASDTEIKARQVEIHHPSQKPFFLSLEKIYMRLDGTCYVVYFDDKDSAVKATSKSDPLLKSLPISIEATVCPGRYGNIRMVITKDIASDTPEEVKELPHQSQ